MTKAELLPCVTPWCDGKGGEPYVFERRFDCLGVYCPTCQVSTPYFPSVEQAVTLWNTRPQPSPKVDGLVETWESIAEWCDQTFGPASPLRMAARANEEMAELIDRATQTATYDESVLIEAADVVICLARFPGIWSAVERKMAINRARQWRLTGEGTGYHIPGAVQP